jgi:hypothetical protein|tara:strand:- start:1314 stop:2027 length:714 start_codon:yes stop_codon:yes gene_type:complete
MRYFIVCLFLSLFIFSCDNTSKITLTKLEGSPAYENAKLEIDTIAFKEQEYSFKFNVLDYNLGEQTEKEFSFDLANSGKGQHIHFIVNNGPYSAYYSNEFNKKLEEGNNVILAFLSRSYHESVKNPNAFFLTQIGEGDKIDLSKEFLFFSRPKGTYTGTDTERLLLDFYLINNSISPTGNKVRATIQGAEFIIDEWVPYYIQGLPKGEISIKLELINSEGDLIQTPFNPSVRKVTLE